MSASDIQTVSGLLDTALAALDYDTALLLAIRLRAYLAATPDQQHVAEIRWDRQSLNGLIGDIRREQSKSVGIQRTNITHARPT